MTMGTTETVKVFIENTDVPWQEMVPGVIYGGAKEVNFFASAKAFKSLVYTSEFQLAEVQVNGNKHVCILKDLQFDKVSDALNHVDLLELVGDKKVVANLPLKFNGAAIGVKNGGKLVLKMKAIKVKAYPKDLRETVDVDLTNLEINGNIRVQDIVAENMEILNSPRIPIASVAMTRQLKQDEATEAKVAAPVDTKAVPDAKADAAPSKK